MDKQQPVATAKPVATQDTGTKSYLVMVVLAFFASITGLARAYRGEKIGWVRFWIYIGSSVLMIIPFINIIAAITLIVLSIWGIVDFFLVYRLRDDADGKPLHATARDQKWAGVFNVLYIVGLALSVLAFILAGIFSAVIFSNIASLAGKNSLNTGSSYNTQIDSDRATESDDNASKVLSNYSKLQDGMSRAEAETALGVQPAENCSEYSFGDTKSESCSYGSYDEGYMISLGFTNDQLNSKSKFQY